MKRSLVIAFLLAFALALPAYAMDEGGTKKPMGMMGGMMGAMMGGMSDMMDDDLMLWNQIKMLGLDEKQKDEIGQLRVAFLKDAIRKKADKQITEIELKEALDKEPADMKAVETSLKKIEAMRTDIVLSGIKTQEAVKSKLTPEQRKKLKEMMSDGKCRMCQMMQKKDSSESDKKEPGGDAGHGH